MCPYANQLRYSNTPHNNRHISILVHWHIIETLAHYRGIIQTLSTGIFG